MLGTGHFSKCGDKRLLLVKNNNYFQLTMRRWGLTLLGGMKTTTAATRITLLTDVEGNWQYVRNFVKQSSCLQLFYEGTKDETLELRDDCMLVFGGDAGDKGDHTLRLDIEVDPFSYFWVQIG